MCKLLVADGAASRHPDSSQPLPQTARTRVVLPDCMLQGEGTAEHRRGNEANSPSKAGREEYSVKWDEVFVFEVLNYVSRQCLLGTQCIAPLRNTALLESDQTVIFCVCGMVHDGLLAF